MSDWRTDYRSERFEYRLLNLNLSPAGVLSGVESCQLHGAINADVRWGGGSINWSGSTMPDWSQYMIHPWYLVDGVGEFPLAPPSYVKAPEVLYDGTVPKTVSLSLYDVSYMLAKRLKLTQSVSYATGTSPITSLASRLVAAGVPKWSITPSTAVLAGPINMDLGESEMKMANALLASAGYWAIHSDLNGVLVGEPYVDPSKRSVAWDFAPGSTAIHDAKRKVSLDDFDIPNRITGVAKVAEGVTPVPVTVILDSIFPDSPYTYAKRGVWVDAEPMRDVDATDADALTAILTRELLDETSVASTLVISHAWIPEVTLGSLVTHVTDRLRRYTVQKMDINCEVGGAPVVSELREVS